MNIPDGVTRIGEGVFQNGNITSITIPNSVTSIGTAAFCGCSDLTSITIPGSVTKIEDYAFLGCEGLEEVHFSTLDSVFKVDYGNKFGPGWEDVEFYINEELITDVVVPDDVEMFCGSFFGCNSLESITIPTSVKTMYELSYLYCSNLERVYFSDLRSLLNMNRIEGSFGSYMKDVDYYVNGELLSDLVIPEGTISIGACAFCGCVCLERVKIPEGVNSIGQEAFIRCENLQEITIPRSVTEIGVCAFSGCDDLTIHASSGSYAEEYAKENSIPFEEL